MLQDLTLDKTVPVPLYYQLKTLILQEIQNGNYPDGSMIPTEIEISEIFDISRTTVRQAVTELVTEGYLYRVKSKGTFVSKPKVQHHLLSPIYRFHDAVAQNGSTSRHEVLKFEVVKMPEELYRLGAPASEERAIYIYRRWHADEDVMERVITYLPYTRFKFLLSEDITNSSLHDIFDRRPETRIYRLVRTCEAVPASHEDIEILGVKKGSAIQKLTTIRYNRAEEFIDVSYSYFRGDKNKLQFEVVIPD